MCSYQTSEHKVDICRSYPFHFIPPLEPYRHLFLPFQEINKTDVITVCCRLPTSTGPKFKGLSSRTCTKTPSHCHSKRGANLGQRSPKCCKVSKAQWLSALWSTRATYLFVATAPCTTLHWRSTLCFSMGALYRGLQLPLGDDPGANKSDHLDSWTPAKDVLLRTLTASPLQHWWTMAETQVTTVVDPLQCSSPTPL